MPAHRPDGLLGRVQGMGRRAAGHVRNPTCVRAWHTSTPRKPGIAPRRRATDLIHADIKKPGRIPQRGGHRSLGQAAGRKNRRAGTGNACLHQAVEDPSGLAQSEIRTDDRCLH